MCKSTAFHAIVSHEDLLWNSAGEYFDEGWEYFRRGQLKVAKASMEAALDSYQQLEDSARVNVANCLTSIGCVLEQQGRLQEALEYHDQARETYQQLDPTSQNLAASYNNIAIVLQIQGRCDEALELFRRARVIQEALDPESLDAAATYSNIGMVLMEQCKYLEAQVMFCQARSIQEQLAPNGLDLAVTLTNMGELLHSWEPQQQQQQQQPADVLDQSLQLYKRAQEIREQLAPNSLPLAIVFRDISNIWRDQGKCLQATGLLRRALAIQQRIAPDSLDVAKTLKDLAKVQKRQRKYAESLETARKATSILLQPHIGIILSHPVHIQVRLVEADVCYELGDYQGAIEAATIVLNVLTQNETAACILGRSLQAMHNSGQAIV